ncbi:hypothetical protein PoB_005160900 [Plakobranchus ocellatus]|uniref:Spaetzle domain-containing protein n=1 Tax=Plakobranchus ocellatus TaxID=259542 RepID=A0AAV4C1V2_9GAST|nr:hypothetical protein PoB_005160900 [Plakobranchus ocellatus]
MEIEMKEKVPVNNTPVKETEGADTGLIDGKPAPPPCNRSSGPTRVSAKMGADCFSSRIWMLLAVTFMAISIALSIYLVYDKGVKDDEVKEVAVSSNATEVLAKYPTYFRTEMEQRAVEIKLQAVRRSQEKKKAPMNADYPALVCQFNCRNITKPARRKRSPQKLIARKSTTKREQWTLRTVFHRLVRRSTQDESHHACCISEVSFITPATGMTDQGETVTIVQFPNHKQYFQTESCSQIENCTGCTCAQEQTLVSAIVLVSADTVTVKYVAIPGCCKCFNNLP